MQARAAVSRIIGVDRLDYTKGLPQKFKAFGRFLEKYPQYRRQVVLTQIAPPTRESVEAYSDIRQQLESLAGSINGRFGELDWVPIHYIHRSTPRRRLGDIYRSSRIGMVTPLRDGMNLVAKEYVAAQDPADPGVLILSQFAGAAEEMTRGADRQSLRHRGDGRSDQGSLGNAPGGASGPLQRPDGSSAQVGCRRLVPVVPGANSSACAAPTGHWETPAPIRDALEKLQQSHGAAPRQDDAANVGARHGCRG